MLKNLIFMNPVTNIQETFPKDQLLLLQHNIPNLLKY